MEPNNDRLIVASTDSHVGPSVAEYRSYLDPRYGPDLDILVEEEREFFELLDFGAMLEFTPEELELVDPRGAIRNGGLDGLTDPGRRLKEAEAEGVVAEVLNPQAQGSYTPWFRTSNRKCSLELRGVGTRAYNRWLADYCSVAPHRLLGMAAMEPWPDMAAMVQEVHWAREIGFGGVVAPQCPGQGDTPGFEDPFWDPFWAVCADEGMPIEFHAGFGLPQGYSWKVFDEYRQETAKTGGASFGGATTDKLFFNDWMAKRPFWQLAWAGVFDRYPGLKLVFTEQHADWVLPLLDYLERRFDEERPPRMTLRPREYWLRHCAIGATSTRRNELAMRDEIGVETFMFGTDFPHTEGTWPNTREWMQATFSDLSEQELRMICGENAIRFFGLDRPKLAELAARVGPRVGDVLGDFDVSPLLIKHFDMRSGYLKPLMSFDLPEVSSLVDDDSAKIATARP